MTKNQVQERPRNPPTVWTRVTTNEATEVSAVHGLAQTSGVNAESQIESTSQPITADGTTCTAKPTSVSSKMQQQHISHRELLAIASSLSPDSDKRASANTTTGDSATLQNPECQVARERGFRGTSPVNVSQRKLAKMLTGPAKKTRYSAFKRVYRKRRKTSFHIQQKRATPLMMKSHTANGSTNGILQAAIGLRALKGKPGI